MKKVTKAVIPVAGFGTRMFPMTKVYPKEFMPISDKNGFIQPTIMYLLEELDNALIEDIYIIVSNDWQKEFYEHFFFCDYTKEEERNLLKSQINYLNKIKKIRKKLHIHLNSNQHGLGYILYQCFSIIHDEDFLLLLGDQIYQSNIKDSCIKQILDNYNGSLTISAAITQLEDVNKYGIMTGKYISSNSFLITNIKEKPTKSYAKKNLGMSYCGDEVYFSVFGTYVLNQRILNQAKEFFDSLNVIEGEYSITSFIENYDLEKVAFIPNGNYYDIGNFLSYNSTYIKFQSSNKQDMETKK